MTWGLGCAALIISINTSIVLFLTRLGFMDLSKGLAEVLSWPLWLRTLAAITAGTVEESLFRGYAIERIASLAGSYGWAGMISLAVFVVVHLPFWGPGIIFNALFGGLISTLLYIWRRDLAACIIAHNVGDAIALIVGPAMNH